VDVVLLSFVIKNILNIYIYNKKREKRKEEKQEQRTSMCLPSSGKWKNR
jgi:hypothetical protein